MAAETHRQTTRDYLEPATERVAGCLGLVDRFDHPLFRSRIDRANRRCIRGRIQVIGQLIGNLRVHTTQHHDVTANAYTKLGQEALGNSPRGHAHGGFARGRALENVTRIRTVVLEYPNEVRMPRPRQVHALHLARFRVDVIWQRFVRHRSLPVLPVVVPHQQRDGRAERFTEADAREETPPCLARCACGRRARTHPGGVSDRG